jgi:drug/metabolite transporter (DMT)-like permease
MSRVVVKAIEDRAQLGIAMMIGAYFFFSLIDTSVKWLLISGIGALQLAFMRYLGHFVISLGAIARGGLDVERFKTEKPLLVLARAYLLWSSTVFNFISLNYLPLTVTGAIMFSAPIFVCLLGWPLLGERAGPWRLFAILLGFFGVLIVMRPFGAEFHWAMLLSVHNAIALSLYSILTRKLSGVVAAETMQFYMGAFGTILLLPVVLWSWTNPTTALDWALMIGIGIWGWAGHELLTRAHGFAPANTLMPYTYSFLIFLTGWSYLIWGDLPDFWTVLGSVIIIGSGLLIWLRERRSKL